MKPWRVGALLLASTLPAFAQSPVGCYHLDRPYGPRYEWSEEEAGWDWLELRDGGRLRLPGLDRGGARSAVERTGRWTQVADTLRITSAAEGTGWEFALTPSGSTTWRGVARYVTDVGAPVERERSASASRNQCPTSPTMARHTVFMCMDRGSLVEVRATPADSARSGEVRVSWEPRARFAPPPPQGMRVLLRRHDDPAPLAVVDSGPAHRLWRVVPGGPLILEVETRMAAFYAVHWGLTARAERRQEVTITLEPRIAC